MDKWVLVVALVIGGGIMTTGDGRHHQFFHGCERSKDCRDDDRVIVCIQPDSCHFDREA